MVFVRKDKGTRREELIGNDPFQSIKSSSDGEKQKLALLRPTYFKGNGWRPMPNIPAYHEGTDNIVAEGPGVIIFKENDTDSKRGTYAFAPVDPLSETPIDPKEIFSIDYPYAGLKKGAIIFRFNLAKIQQYEERTRNEKGSMMISTSVNTQQNIRDLGEYISAVVRENNAVDISKKKGGISCSELKATIESSEQYRKKKAIEEDLYSDEDDDEDARIGTADKGKDTDGESKPAHVLLVAVKYLNGNIQWFTWEQFKAYKSDDNLNLSQKKEIKEAIDSLAKSKPETWEVLSPFYQ